MSILGDDVPYGCFYTCRVTPRKIWCAERYTLTCPQVYGQVPQYLRHCSTLGKYAYGWQ